MDTQHWVTVRDSDGMIVSSVPREGNEELLKAVPDGWTIKDEPMPGVGITRLV